MNTTWKLTPVMRVISQCRYFLTGSTLLKDNVILMGSPGSGKTTVGQLLAQQLQRPAVDVDNDHLEKYWGMPVAQKLAEVGSEGFIEAEGDATTSLKVTNSIISLTGSSPMHNRAMQHIKSLGIIVFLDTQHSDILQRLEKMKVNRIVGQGPNKSMEDILKYRQQFYEDNYDIRIIVEPNECPESIATKIVEALNSHKLKQGYVSTRGAHRGDSIRPNFNQVVLKGLAPDKGLYVPRINKFPNFSTKQLLRLVDLCYAERALRILEQWIHPDDIHPSQLRVMLNEAYSTDHFSSKDIFPVRKLHDGVFLSELFHGPTASFKDAALQLMPKFFHNALTTSTCNDRYLILVATSGDTGGAVLDGFGKLPDNCNVKVLVLYPEEGISNIQKAQMTSATGTNVSVIGVKADFDFCQSSIKSIFSSQTLSNELKENYGIILSAANSINWGRLLPQIVYHITSYLDLVKMKVISMGDQVDLCIPTGNFGNILAAYYAKNVGIPYRHIVCASNTNNILTDFLTTGVYDLRSRQLHLTSSPAIDILKSSNLERFLYHTAGNDPLITASLYHDLEKNGRFVVSSQVLEAVKVFFSAGWCNEDQCFDVIKDTYTRTGYLLDPHTAVALHVSKRFQTPHHPMLISSTAHYGKFADDVLTATGHSNPESGLSSLFHHFSSLNATPEPHLSLIQSISRPRRHNIICDANINRILSEIRQFVSL